MTPVIIPNKIASRDDLVVIPKKEYEALLILKKYKEFKATSAERKALTQAENNFKKGRTLSYHELVQKLGLTR